MKAKEGLDGSGRHSVYNQQGQGSIESHNMIIWMWVPLDLAMVDQPSTSTCSSSRNSVSLWKEGAPSSWKGRQGFA